MNKLKALQEVMEYSRFFHHIEESFKRSGKDREAFKIVINMYKLVSQEKPEDDGDYQKRILRKRALHIG